MSRDEPLVVSEDHLFAREVGAGLEAAVSTVCFHLALCLSAFGARRGRLRGLLRASVALQVRLLFVWVCVLCASSKLVVLLVLLIIGLLSDHLLLCDLVLVSF